MANHAKVLNLFTKSRIKRSQARRLVEQCAYAWVDDKSIRKLKLDEMVKARSEQAKLREGLNYFVVGKDGKLIAKPYLTEIPGLKYEPSATGLAAYRHGLQILRETQQFVMSQI